MVPPGTTIHKKLLFETHKPTSDSQISRHFCGRLAWIHVKRTNWSANLANFFHNVQLGRYTLSTNVRVERVARRHGHDIVEEQRFDIVFLSARSVQSSGASQNWAFIIVHGVIHECHDGAAGCGRENLRSRSCGDRGGAAVAATGQSQARRSAQAKCGARHRLRW